MAMVDHMRMQIMNIMYRRHESTLTMVKELSPRKEKAIAIVWFLGVGRRFPSSSGRASTRDADPLPTADFPSSSGHCFALLSLVAGHRVVPLCCALDFLVLPDSKPDSGEIQSVALEPLGLRQVLIFGYFDLGISYQRLRENDWHYCSSDDPASAVTPSGRIPPAVT
ncbi:hypothetical protein ZIOFF_033709 [Zingiber officinale]|uniref:Uncharacterized protein n=1 Tax=Zingiber officinale TaxID=94328 RepID=A0A8J5GR33_ZINOF|nr:hypothetical protein ZIOFF_033709 [Zingiber officinale]